MPWRRTRAETEPGPGMEHADLGRWMARYERAWRTAGTVPLEDLFTADASYRNAPFAEPIQGRAAIGSFWESERDSPDEVFTMCWEPVAVEDAVCVVRVEVAYGTPPAKVYRDLWIVTLEPDGHCSAFEEWPFFPGQPLSSREPGGAGPAD